MLNKEFKFTQDDLDNMILEALEGEAKVTQGMPEKPNVLQLLREKKKQGGGRWPLT